MKRVVILGAGQAGKVVLSLLNPDVMEAVAFGDNNPCVCNSVGGIPVLPVAEALGCNPDLVIISVLGAERSEQLRSQLCKLGFEGEIMPFNIINRCLDIR